MDLLDKGRRSHYFSRQ